MKKLIIALVSVFAVSLCCCGGAITLYQIAPSTPESREANRKKAAEAEDILSKQKQAANRQFLPQTAKEREAVNDWVDLVNRNDKQGQEQWQERNPILVRNMVNQMKMKERMIKAKQGP